MQKYIKPPREPQVNPLQLKLFGSEVYPSFWNEKLQLCNEYAQNLFHAKLRS